MLSYPEIIANWVCFGSHVVFAIWIFLR